MRILNAASNRNNNSSFNMYVQYDTELILIRSSNRNNSRLFNYSLGKIYY